MTQNKNHWYDGWFYDTIIAPNQDKLFGQIKELIESHSKVIDVGCGTGRLAFALADQGISVLGIDLSKRNIDRANLNLLQQPNDQITFEHLSLSEICNQRLHTHFDYAVITYVIHEVNENERIILLNEKSHRCTGKIKHAHQSDCPQFMNLLLQSETIKT